MRKELYDMMVKLYSTATTPYIILDKKTGAIIEQGARWVTEEAKQTYNRCQEILKEIILKERKRNFIKLTNQK